MRKSLLSLSIVLVLSLIILACNLPFITTATQEPGLVATSVAKTVAALYAQQQTTPTLAQAPTLAPLPTVAQLPTLVLPPTATPVPCNWAKLVSETPLDSANFNINTNFNKSWRVRNAGTCTWNTNYRISFYSGVSMGGPASKQFSHNVAPGETIDLIVPLKAPATAGTYKGYWHLYGADNVDFTQAYGLWVTINAVNPVAAFAVTGVSTTVNNSAPAACPLPFVFTANITANGAGTVTYHWNRSDGANSAVQTLTFGAAGSQSVSYTWSLGATGAAWARVYIDSPNHQYFSPANVTCP